jgi:hypothetical protein
MQNGGTLKSVPELKFEEIILESNEIDLEELQSLPDFKEQKFQNSLFVG